MSLSPRTITHSAGWILAIAIGFFMGRQTGETNNPASSGIGASGPPTSFARSAASGETRPANAAKRSDGDGPVPSPRRSRERTIAALGEALRHPDRLTRTRRILDLGETNDWTVGLVSGIASNDPNNALKFIEGIESRSTRIKSLQSIMPHVLQHGTEYATDWVAGISNEELRLGSLRNLARDLHRLDADQAGSWVNSLPDDESRREAAIVIAEQWARTDLEKASQWAATLPAASKSVAAGSISRQMARFDPEQAAIWLRSLGTDPSLDPARRSFIQEAAGKAPQVALENVYSLSQAADQEKMYHQVLKTWSKKNSKAVKTWVDYNIDALPASVVKRYAPTPKPAPKEKPKKDPKNPAKNKASKKKGKV